MKVLMKSLNLNEKQLEAIEYMDGPLLVLAGAGSGKTRVLTRKIARIIECRFAQPWEILAMTFTNKAAGEMRERIERLLPGSGARVRMGTFHSICAWMLRREAHQLGYSENFTIYDADDQKTLIRRLLKDSAIVSRITPASLKGYISNSKNREISPEEALQQAMNQRETDLAELYRRYQSRLKDYGAFDFDDLLTGVLEIFRQNIDIRDHYASLFSFVLVDEYQDTNRVQHELLKELASNGAVVCVVGDDDQSIYAWRGACVENILEFSDDFPGTRIIRLEENYRSSGNILKGASALVRHNRMRHGKTLWTKKAEGCPIRIKALYNESEEAQWILQEIMELFEGGSCPGDSIAVLYRTNAQSRQFETACMKYGVEYEVVGSQRFYERLEIKDIVAYLRILLNHSDHLSLQRIINRPSRGLGKKGRGAFFAHMDSTCSDPLDLMLSPDQVQGLSTKARSELSKMGEWYRMAEDLILEGASAASIVNSLLENIPITSLYDPDDITDQSRLENIAEFRRSVEEYDTMVPGGGISGFMTEISLETTKDDYHGDACGKVALMTLHCAKGLEFNTVFVAGLEEGMLPFVRQGEFAPADMEEERRLLYVGMTRAQERLILTYVINRTRGGVRHSGPSRFIDEIVSGDNRFQGSGEIAGTGSPVSDLGIVRSDGLSYARGNLIKHPRYGKGLVTRAVRRESEWQITVDFGFDEPKTLVTGYVPIPILKVKGSAADLD